MGISVFTPLLQILSDLFGVFGRGFGTVFHFEGIGTDHGAIAKVSSLPRGRKGPFEMIDFNCGDF